MPTAAPADKSAPLATIGDFMLNSPEQDIEAALAANRAAAPPEMNLAKNPVAPEPVVPAPEKKPEDVEKPAAKVEPEKPVVPEKKPEATPEFKLPDDLLKLGKQEDKPEIPVETNGHAASDEALEGIKLSDKASRASSEAFAKVKKVAKERGDELAKTKADFEKFKAEAEKIKAAPPVADPLVLAELEQTKKQLAEYDQELKVVKVEATREFKETIKKPMEETAKAATELCQRNDLPAADLLAAFNEPDKGKRYAALSTISAGMNDFDREELRDLAKSYRDLADKRSRIVSDADVALALINQKRETQEKLLREQQTSTMTEQQKSIEQGWQAGMEKSFQHVVSQIPYFKRAEGNETWNKGIDEIENTVKQLDYKKLVDLPVATQTQLVTAGLCLPHVARTAQALQARLQSVEAELAKYRKSSPRAGGTSTDAGAAVADDPTETNESRMGRLALSIPGIRG